ncbi:MAG: amidohydrolase family protein [Rhodospirillaceae bacterium]|jgi:predicted TIM-barrel fold metal-dependent hydrolase
MARDGFKVFDSDTHVGPYVNILEKYFAAETKEKLKGWEEYKKAHFRTGHVTYLKGQRKYRRQLGQAAATPPGDNERYMAGFKGAFKGREPHPKVDLDPAARIEDMDLEGVDVNLTLPSGWFGTFTSDDDIELEAAMYRAYHEWMNDYCGAYPDRLGGVILACARDVAGSVKEIKKWGTSRWAWGVMVYAPVGMPLDHPDLEPVWKAAADHDLCVALHTFTVMPPYAPGGLDNWENLFLQRSASHPWCGMRNMASLIGSGLMDRYPDIRIGTLEAGHSWLPFWMARTDEHYHTIRTALPEDLQHKPSDYVLSGRYFQSIEIPEGDKLTNAIMDLIGDDVLMYASDYPHGESWFPKSVETVLGWDMSEERKRKLFWDNAVKLYARCGLT